MNKPYLYDQKFNYDEYKAYIESHTWDELRNAKFYELVEIIPSSQE